MGFGGREIFKVGGFDKGGAVVLEKAESLSCGKGGPMLAWVWVSELYRGRVFSLKGCIYI